MAVASVEDTTEPCKRQLDVFWIGCAFIDIAASKNKLIAYINLVIGLYLVAKLIKINTVNNT